MAEYRQVPDEDEAAFRRVLDYAFRAEAGPEPDHDDDPGWIGERRAIYVDGAPVTTAARLPLTVTVRGAWVDVVGLSAVATLPEHRRQGRVGQLLRASLAESREAGVPVSLLWPFKHPFYRRFGWGRLGDLGRYEFEPAALSPTADHPLAGGSFGRLEADDHPELQAVDERFADRFDLTMRRTADWYRHRFFEGREADPFVYGWRRDGELGGYLRYTVEEEDDGRVLRVTDFAAPDEAAAVNLYRFLHRHEAQVEGVELFAPADDRLFDLVDDPRGVELTLRPGPMGRLVAVADGLGRLPAPEGVEAAATVAVADGLADWNDDTFAIAAPDGTYAVESAARADPDASMPIETLSRLAFGSMTAERAALAGGLEADDGTVESLHALFPPRPSSLREFF